jgi:hypothetical protein
VIPRLQRVVPVVAEQVVVALASGEEVVLVAALDAAGREDVLALAPAALLGLERSTALRELVVGASLEPIAAVLAGELVVALPGEDQVVPLLAEELVPAAAPADDVVARRAGQEIVGRGSLDRALGPRSGRGRAEAEAGDGKCNGGDARAGPILGPVGGLPTVGISV